MTYSQPEGDRTVQVPFDALREVLDAFVACEDGRSVALCTLRGPTLELERYGRMQRPGASLLKLGIALAFDREVAAGRLEPTREVRVSQLPQTSYSSVARLFDSHRALSLAELCRLMIATSDNPLAEALLELIGMEAVNSLFSELGCEETFLAVGFGDEFLGRRGRTNVTTALDMIAVLRHANTAVSATDLVLSMRNGLRRTRIPLRLPDELSIANKTGSLMGVVNDVAILYGDVFDLAIAFLCDSQLDTARTSTDIGDTAQGVWSILGEQIE